MNRETFARKVQEEAGSNWQGLIIHGGHALLALVAKDQLMTAYARPVETKSFRVGQMEDIKGDPSGTITFTANGYKVKVVSRSNLFVIDGGIAHAHSSPYTQNCRFLPVRVKLQDFPALSGKQ